MKKLWSLAYIDREGFELMWSEGKIEAYLKENLKEKRVLHTLGVRDTAVKLAKLYGENAAKASLAALLHDCAKSLKDKELIHTVSKKGLAIDWIQEKSPQLLHGHVAAIIAEDIMEVNDKDVLEAVTYHTTGKSNMSTLVKIIYLADYIEPGRSFPGVEELRKTAEVNLDEAVLMALEGTIKYVVSCRELLHPDTIEARNDLLIKRQ